MFVNYFKKSTRTTPINLAACRVLLGVYVLWRVASIDAWALVEWPVFLYPLYGFLYPPAGLEWILVVEKWVVLGAASLFLVGYRTRASAFTTAVLFAHLATVTMALNHTGATQQMGIACLLVVLFGLYAERDVISVDTIRATRNASLAKLNDDLKGSVEGTYRMEPLKWGLVLLGVLYAGGPWMRAIQTGLSNWTAPESLARWMTYFHTILRGEPILGQLLVDSTLLLQLATWGTIVTEVSLLVFVLLGVSVTPVIVLLIGMHLTIFATMQILFLDMLFFLLLFASFDRAYARLVTDREIDLVYDERCFFCARSLYLFKLLDVNGTVTFYSQSDAPAKYSEQDGVDFEDRMYVFTDGERYGGYWAFRELLRQFWFTVPLAWSMQFTPIARVGERVYRYVADNRDRYFVCGVGDGDVS